MIKIAIEGVSHSGKTTVIKNLVERFKSNKVVVLPEYVDAVDDLADIPDTPASNKREELEGLRFLLNVDFRRWVRAFDTSCDFHLVIMNRSIHTLLAHRYAIEKLTGLKVFLDSIKMVENYKLAMIPDLIFYIDVSQEKLNGRYGKRQETISEKNPHLKPNPIFFNSDYNLHFRQYFLPHLKVNKGLLIAVNGKQSRNRISSKIFEFIKPNIENKILCI